MIHEKWEALYYRSLSDSFQTERVREIKMKCKDQNEGIKKEKG